MQKYTINICGQSYSIVSDESLLSVQDLAKQVNDQMENIAKAIGTTDTQKIATYTALMYASAARDNEKKALALINLCEK